MEMDLTKYGIEELVELKNKISEMINDYKDGYFYICNVRSYGRNWNDNFIFNFHTLQELCYQYNGDNGIVDVYSNNPDLSKLDNYGDVMFVPTEKDYLLWKEYTFMSNYIRDIEEGLDEWDNRDNIPFVSRPKFRPIHSRERLAELKKEYENYDTSFVTPTPVERAF